MTLHDVNETVVTEELDGPPSRSPGNAELALEICFARHGITGRQTPVRDGQSYELGQLNIEVGITLAIQHGRTLAVAPEVGWPP